MKISDEKGVRGQRLRRNILNRGYMFKGIEVEMKELKQYGCKVENKGISSEGRDWSKGRVKFQ